MNRCSNIHVQRRTHTVELIDWLTLILLIYWLVDFIVFFVCFFFEFSRYLTSIIVTSFIMRSSQSEEQYLSEGSFFCLQGSFQKSSSNYILLLAKD